MANRKMNSNEMEMICVQYSPKIYVDAASQRGIVKVGFVLRMG